MTLKVPDYKPRALGPLASVTAVAVVVAGAALFWLRPHAAPSSAHINPSDTAYAIRSGRVLITATDSRPYTVVVDGRALGTVGDTISQPVGTTSHYTLRPDKGVDFCPIDITIDFPYKRTCARCNVSARRANETACR